MRVERLAETRIAGWDDPEMAPKLRQLFLDAQSANKGVTRALAEDSQRLVLEGSLEALHQLTHLAISAIGAGLMVEGVGDTVRVELTNDRDNFALRVFGLARSGDGEVLFGELSQTLTNPTATEGVTLAYRLHITPQGGRGLWDFGDIIQAASEEARN